MPVLKDHRQEQFARYIAQGMPIGEATERAGFYAGSEPHIQSSNGKKIANRPLVARRIQELREQSAARTTVTVARVLEEMAKIGFANMMDYMKVQEDGTAYVDLKDLSRDKAAAISEIVVDEFVEGRGDEARAVKRVRLKLHDKRAALMDMGKHLGMFKQQVEHTGKDGGPIESRNKVEVSLLSRDEREMLKQLLLLAAERKRGQAAGLEAPVMDLEPDDQ